MSEPKVVWRTTRFFEQCHAAELAARDVHKELAIMGFTYCEIADEWTAPRGWSAADVENALRRVYGPLAPQE